MTHAQDISRPQADARQDAGLRRSGAQDRMTVARAVTAFAGIMVLLSLLLAWFVSPLFLGLTGFVGVNLLQSSFTGFCPAASVFRRLGFTECPL